MPSSGRRRAVFITDLRQRQAPGDPGPGVFCSAAKSASHLDPHPPSAITNLEVWTFGTLAVGPKTFSDLYDTILRKNGISTAMTEGATPKEWDGSVFSEFPKLTAFIFDDRYVVAEAAIVEEL